MKTKEEIKKYIRDEITNPMIGKMIMDMTEEGVPYEDIMEMAKILIDNTPNVESKMVDDHIRDLRIKEGEQILSTIKNLK